MKKLLFGPHLTFSLFVIFSLISCSENRIINFNKPVIDNSYSEITFSDKLELFSYPNFGSIHTKFKFNIRLKDSSISLNNVRYDYTFNKEYDTTATIWDTVKTKFSLFGYNTVIASIELEDKSVISCSTKIWVTEPKKIFSDGGALFEPNFYNGHTISLTHGSHHRVQFIDIATLEIDECYFCGFNSSRFDEMHYSVLSFDGNKLMFDNGIKYYFCYYDLEKNDSITVDLPINIPRQPTGQITWSLDNNSVYYVALENYQLSGIKSYNLITKEISDIYSKGDFICIVPDQPDKLAILEKTSDSTSNLIIYNIFAKLVENVFEDIPFYAPFRMLRDKDRIYFDGELAFYSLSKRNIYYLQFDELNLSNHTIGEADINMDGNKIIIGTWQGDRTLYYVTLPNYF